RFYLGSKSVESLLFRLQRYHKHVVARSRKIDLALADQGVIPEDAKPRAGVLSSGNGDSQLKGLAFRQPPRRYKFGDRYFSTSAARSARLHPSSVDFDELCSQQTRFFD